MGSKLLERCVYIQLIQYLEENNLLDSIIKLNLEIYDLKYSARMDLSFKTGYLISAYAQTPHPGYEWQEIKLGISTSNERKMFSLYLLR